MLILGLLILAAAVVVGVDAVASNTGSAHAVPGGVHFFGYLVHGSVGQAFLAGIIVGAVGLVGLALVFDGMHRSARLRRELAFARREISRSRRRAADAEKAAADAEATRPTTPVAPAPEPAPEPVAVTRRTTTETEVPADSDTSTGESRVPAWVALARRRSQQPAATAGASTDSTSSTS